MAYRQAHAKHQSQASQADGEMEVEVSVDAKEDGEQSQRFRRDRTSQHSASWTANNKRARGQNKLILRMAISDAGTNKAWLAVLQLYMQMENREWRD